MRVPKIGLALAFIALAGCNADKSGSDSEGGSGSGSDENRDPIADAGADQDLGADDLFVTLDGRGSYDPDGDALKFYWEFDRIPESSALDEKESPFTANHSSETTTTFRPDALGTYVIKLIVKDDTGRKSDPDYAIISVTEVDLPIADAGADQTGGIGDTISLDGTDSYDPSGRDLTYTWTLASAPSASAASLTDDAASSTAFTADAGGLYVASLVVSNGLSESLPDSALIRISSADPTAPTAIAGDDIDASDCTSVSLDGSASYDANEEDSLTYFWAIQTKPDESSTTDRVSFSDRNAVSPTFWPDVAGDYSLSLTVYDGTYWSDPDVVALNVSERSYNSEPTVEAGDDQTVDAGTAACEVSGYSYECESCASQIITLGSDGSVSDADSDPYEIGWELVSADATASISDASSLVTTVTLSDLTPTAPEETETFEFVFQLSGTDCPGEVGADTIAITVSCTGEPLGSDSAR